jgi:hypothetical protein
VGIDDRGDRVGRVVESVHELEAERDQERHEQQEKRQPGLALRFLQVANELVADLREADEQHDANDQRQQPRGLVEIRSSRYGRRCRGCGHGSFPPAGLRQPGSVL